MWCFDRFVGRWIRPQLQLLAANKSAACATPSGPQLVPTSETLSLGFPPTLCADSLRGITQPRSFSTRSRANVTRETSYLRVAMNTTNPLGGIHEALDRYEADGRPPAAELPPTRGAEAALLELGGSRPRFALAPEPRLSLERTDTGMTRSDSMTETSELLTSLAHARVPPPPPPRRPPPPPRIITFSPPGPRRLGWVGAYSPEARKRRIARFHAKRKRSRPVWKSTSELFAVTATT